MIYVLNPLVVAPDGEWEAWRFANWIPGAERFPSFELLMRAEHALFLNNQPRPEAVVLGRPPEGADYVRLPPLGAWSWSGPSFLPGTGRGFSVDDDFQAYPLSCESLPKP